MQKIISDVVVVGGGLAGMYAALTAEQQGCKVLMVCKNKIGRSGSSVVAQTVHRVAEQNTLNQELYFNFFWQSGRFMGNPELIKTLISEGPRAVNHVMSLGVHFEKGVETLPNGGEITRYSCEPRKGKLLTTPVAEQVRKSGISMLENTMVIDVIFQAGEINGLVCLCKNKILLVFAKAVILATGGFGRIFSETSNPIGITGDGQAIAARAGARLTGLEFIQFYPYRLRWPKIFDLNPAIFDQGALFINEKKERFMRNFPKAEQENRDKLAQEMFKQREVFLDLSGMSQKDLEKHPILADLVKQGYGSHLKMQVTAHFSMGGIQINSEGETDIPGLFACGECTGGIHGANRLAGSALVECAVFGPRAGRSAATYATENATQTITPPTLNLPLLGNDNIRTLVLLLRPLMWTKAGVQRSEGDLLQCQSELIGLSEMLTHLQPSSYQHWFEAKNMLQISKSVVESALVRRETRGSHLRIDYPNENSISQQL
ncbi:FAD-binding protein [Desulfitobacterium sp.]|uniref:FAD-binding protein n=1 Tax=Desulfitobacterium sp. TaxID=49981 RepID=UPI002BC763BF|nr:FAD-binding protein [Desulfitobacterium sp.]HVJ49168.1 FAD-binding protein [Desulfitobacterium sp.]